MAHISVDAMVMLLERLTNIEEKLDGLVHARPVDKQQMVDRIFAVIDKLGNCVNIGELAQAFAPVLVNANDSGVDKLRHVVMSLRDDVVRNVRFRRCLDTYLRDHENLQVLLSRLHDKNEMFEDFADPDDDLSIRDVLKMCDVAQ